MEGEVVAAVRAALAGSGVDLVASCDAADYDARAPEALASARLLPGARGLVVVGSAGTSLWRAFSAWRAADPAREALAHPLDAYVAGALDGADAALGAMGVLARRFEPTVYARPALDFRALGALVGLGSMGPFGLLIHEHHGPWWALRGAWLVDREVDPPRAHRPPCEGCAAPCTGGLTIAVADASGEVRARCVVGQASRYGDEQVAFHARPRTA